MSIFGVAIAYHQIHCYHDVPVSSPSSSAMSSSVAFNKLQITENADGRQIYSAGAMKRATKDGENQSESDTKVTTTIFPSPTYEW